MNFQTPNAKIMEVDMAEMVRMNLMICLSVQCGIVLWVSNAAGFRDSSNFVFSVLLKLT